MSNEILGKITSRPEGKDLPRLTDAHKAVLKDPRKVRQLTKLVKTSPKWGTVWAEFDGLVWGFAVSCYSQTITVGDPDDEDQTVQMDVDVWSFNTGYMEGRLTTVCKEFSNFPSAVVEDDTDDVDVEDGERRRPTMIDDEGNERPQPMMG
jgi:hypothetical protein